MGSATRDYFGHTSANGDTVADRLSGANFIPRSDRWRAGENVAAGHDQAGSPAAIVRGSMNRRPHRVNLLDSGFTMAGIGVARGRPGGDYADDDAITIALDLGRRRP